MNTRPLAVGQQAGDEQAGLIVGEEARHNTSGAKLAVGWSAPLALDSLLRASHVE